MFSPQTNKSHSGGLGRPRAALPVSSRVILQTRLLGGGLPGSVCGLLISLEVYLRHAVAAALESHNSLQYIYGI